MARGTKYLVGAALIQAGLMPLQADVVADFEGGNSTSSVDAYTGAVGNGWTTIWKTKPSVASASSAAATVASSVTSDHPLAVGGGAYLSTSITAEASPNGVAQGTVYRGYSVPAISAGASFTRIEFDFRPQVVTSNSRYVIFDNVSGATGTGSSVTWQIAGTAGHWVFYDGQGANVTNVYYDTDDGLIANRTYHFIVDVMANGTWQGTVSSTDPTSGTVSTFTSPVIGFRTANTTLQGNLYFGAGSSVVNAPGAFQFDVDAIRISTISVPEAATLGLALAALPAFLKRRRI